MRRNGVEVLSIINPKSLDMIGSLDHLRANSATLRDLGERAKDRWPQMFAAGVVAAAGMSVLADIMAGSGRPQGSGLGYAPSSSAGAFQPGQMKDKTSLALGLVIGAAASWLFLPARQRAVTQELVRNSSTLHRNKHTYYVRVPAKGDVFPHDRETGKPRPQGYALRSAQDFARIGSQTGKPREVRRDRPRGALVRRYVKGKRTFPRDAAEARRRGLLPTEMPSR